MSGSSAERILSTVSGDSYGNVGTESSSSGMICDESKIGEGKELSYAVRTNNATDSTEELSQQVESIESETNEKDSPPVENNTDHEISPRSIADKNVSLNCRVSDGLDDDTNLNGNNDEAKISPIGESEENKINMDEDNAPCKENNVEEDTNNGCDTDYSQGETKENVSISLGVNGEKGMQEISANGHQPIRKTHSIHLIPEAFEDDPVDDDERDSQLSSYDGEDDGVESEIPRVLLNTNCISARSDNRPQTTSTMCELPGGLRAKANTPASFYNNNEVDSPVYQSEKVSGRLSSRESRDEVFNRAMTLMSNRCTSARGGENGLFSNREPPYGIHIPHYFFVYQKKPQPLAPLKAWRGYKGNVYFEPMNIQRVKNDIDHNNNGIDRFNDSDHNHHQQNDNDIHYDNNNMTRNQYHQQLPPNRSMLRSAPLPRTRGGNSKPNTASTAATRGLVSSSASCRPSYRLVSSSSSQVYVMDKSMVVNGQNANMNTDLRFIEGVESTGSLSVSQPGLSLSRSHHEFDSWNENNKINNDNGINNNRNIDNNQFMSHNSKLQPNKDKRLLHKRDRICRGSNFHKNKDKSSDQGGINRNNKVFSIKLSDPKKKLITPDNSRRTSGVGSRMSNRRNTPGSANSNTSSSRPRINNNSNNSNPVRSMELMVSGDRFSHLPSKPVSSMQAGSHSAHHRRLFPTTNPDRITLDDMDAFINASDNLPRVNQVHVTLGHMVEESLPATTPAYSDNESDAGDDDDNNNEKEGDDNDKAAVDFVDMNFKELTTETPTIPVD